MKDTFQNIGVGCFGYGLEEIAREKPAPFRHPCLFDVKPCAFDVPELMRISREVGMDLQGTVVSLDGIYDCQANRKAIFNRGMVPNIKLNPRQKAAQAGSQADLPPAGHLQEAA